MRHRGIALLAIALTLSACGGASEAPAGNAAVETQPAPKAVLPIGNGSGEANAAAPAAPIPTLAGNGLEPGLAFGMPRAQAVEAARAVFGTPTGRQHNGECGEGPMDFISFRDLQLGFREGRLTGWSLSGADPALRSARGLAIGAPRSVLGDAALDRESTLGPEFVVDEIGGLLDENATRIEALWAGDACLFR
jgi:hypothetical protein